MANKKGDERMNKIRGEEPTTIVIDEICPSCKKAVTQTERKWQGWIETITDCAHCGLHIGEVSSPTGRKHFYKEVKK
jgi:uncharacterized protein (DUF983 family)